jgi:hypothetical protein
MSLDSSAWAAENAISATGSHLDQGKEIYGHVNSIQPVDDETVRAQIGQVKLLLPIGLNLPVGRRIFLARTDRSEYVTWIAPEEEHEPPAQNICPTGITIDEICREIESGNLIAFLKSRLGDHVDLSLVSFSPVVAPDAERLGMSNIPACSEPLSQAVPKGNLKACSKDATARKPRTRAKARTKNARASNQKGARAI